VVDQTSSSGSRLRPVTSHAKWLAEALSRTKKS